MAHETRPAPVAPRPRENRLLILTVVVSAVMLLVLSRFRFPSADRPLVPPAVPLERLAARATYDELASVVGRVKERIEPAVVVLRVSEPFAGAGPGAEMAADAGLPQYVPALRVKPGLAIAAMSAGIHVQEIVGEPEAVPVVLATDPLRHLALVRVPDATVPLPWQVEASFTMPSYVIAVTGSRGGVSTWPLFVGRSDPISLPPWEDPLLAFGGAAQAEPGALLFTLEGTFIGIKLRETRFFAVAPVPSLVAALDRLEQGHTQASSDLGIQLQPLTPRLALATGAAHGAVVSYVSPTGPAANILQVGDVIEAVEDEAVYSVPGVRLRESATPPGTTVTLGVVRKSRQVRVAVVTAASGGQQDAAGPPVLGLTLRAIAGVGVEVVRVVPATAGAEAGLQVGDTITSLNGEPAPTPGAVSRAFAAASAEEVLVLGVQRRHMHVVLALAKQRLGESES